VENPVVRWQRRSSCACGVNRVMRCPAGHLQPPLPMVCFPLSGFILGSKRGCTTSGAWPARRNQVVPPAPGQCLDFLDLPSALGRMDRVWTARQCSLSRIPLLPYIRRTLSFPQQWLISSPFLLPHLPSLVRWLLHLTSRSASSAQTAEIPTQ
jgi:hypothetical protein